VITSRDNRWFRRVRDALREHDAEIVIEGPKAVRDALAAGWNPIAVLCTEPALRRLELETPERRLYVLARELFREIADTKTSQGVIGLFERPLADRVRFFDRRDSIFVALDGVQDPGNAGTVVRLAAAFDAAGVIALPGCADLFSPKAVRASAGAILTVPVTGMTVEQLLETGLDLYAAAAGATRHDLPAGNAILILGSEGSGVSSPLRQRATAVSVATTRNVESLNVAAAAAILLWRSFCTRTGRE